MKKSQFYFTNFINTEQKLNVLQQVQIETLVIKKNKIKRKNYSTKRQNTTKNYFEIQHNSNNKISYQFHHKYLIILFIIFYLVNCTSSATLAGSYNRLFQYQLFLSANNSVKVNLTVQTFGFPLTLTLHSDLDQTFQEKYFCFQFNCNTNFNISNPGWYYLNLNQPPTQVISHYHMILSNQDDQIFFNDKRQSVEANSIQGQAFLQKFINYTIELISFNVAPQYGQNYIALADQKGEITQQYKSVNGNLTMNYIQMGVFNNTMIGVSRKFNQKCSTYLCPYVVTATQANLTCQSQDEIFNSQGQCYKCKNIQFSLGYRITKQACACQSKYYWNHHIKGCCDRLTSGPCCLNQSQKFIKGICQFINTTVSILCLQGYFYDQNLSQCFPIICASSLNCQLCNINQSCIRCKIGYYLQDLACQKEICTIKNCILCSKNKCIECDIGFTVFDDHYKCIPCVAKCSNCSKFNISLCTNVWIGYYRTANNEHKNCALECQQCSNNNQCNICINGYHLNLNKTCLINCIWPCQQCSYNGSKCLNCTLGYIVHQNQCVIDGNYIHKHNQICPQLFVLNQLSVCQKCNVIDKNCFRCVKDQLNLCKQCLYGYYLTKSYQCTKCNLGCLSCTNDTYCFECSLGFYQDNNKCLICSSLCLTCRKTSTSCSSCHQGYELNSLGWKCTPQNKISYELQLNIQYSNFIQNISNIEQALINFNNTEITNTIINVQASNKSVKLINEVSSLSPLILNNYINNLMNEKDINSIDIKNFKVLSSSINNKIQSNKIIQKQVYINIILICVISFCFLILCIFGTISFILFYFKKQKSNTQQQSPTITQGDLSVDKISQSIAI